MKGHIMSMTLTENSSQRCDAKIETICSKLQQGISDCTINPLVPKAFQIPIQSQALTEAIDALMTLARTPLEEKIQAQQEEIDQMHKAITHLQSLLID
jgi:response regulator of citrate/malate metabolism